jgi:galactitol-specific phosphotransferase system IIB component
VKVLRNGGKEESPGELVERISKNCEKLELKKELKKEKEELITMRLYGEALLGVVNMGVSEAELEEMEGIKEWVMTEKRKWREMIRMLRISVEDCKECKALMKKVYMYCSINKLAEELGLKGDNYPNVVKEIIREK